MVFGWGKKRTDDTPQITQKEILLSEIRPTLESMLKQEESNLVQHTTKLQFPITHHIESILKIATQIEREPLNTDEVDAKVAIIVKRGKKQVLDIIGKESKKTLPDIKTADDVLLFYKITSQTLAKIGDILGKQTKVIHLFAKKHTNELKSILGNFKQDLEHSDRLIQKYKKFEDAHNHVIAILDEMSADEQTHTSNTAKISGLTERISKNNNEISSIEEKISQYKASPNYIKYNEIKKQLDVLESRRSEIEREINNQTILISRPVTKYEYGSALDKETKVLVEKFLSSPFDVFLSKNKQGVQTILNNIKKAISLDHLSVKEPQKTLAYLDDIMSKLDGFINQVESHIDKQTKLVDQMNALDIHVLHDLQKQHSKIKSDIEFSQTRMTELEKENQSIDESRQARITDIQYRLNQLGDTRYTVKS